MPKTIEPQTDKIRQVRDALRVTGELVAAARKERGWSQAELGRRLGGIDRRHVSAMESGDPRSDFGLLVSTLWLLNLPLLTTLSLGNHSSSGNLNSAIDAVVRLSKRTSSDAPAASSETTRLEGANRKKVVDNDF